ncbi:hypothetical protein V2J09_019026 [Rumex salicifolius]
MGPSTINTESSAAGKCHLVAVPYPGRGHINPLLNLCRLIASKSPNLTITFVVTEEWLGFLTDGFEPDPPANFRFGVIPQVVPSEAGRADDMESFLEAVYSKMEAPVDRLLDRLEPPVTALVCDAFMYWVLEVASRRNIPAAALCPTSASMYNLLSHYDLLIQNGHVPLVVSERGNEIVDYIPGISPTAISDLPYIFNNGDGSAIHRLLRSVAAIPKARFLLLASTREFEGAAIDALNAKFSPTTAVLPIGPMIPYINLPIAVSDSHSYIKWLDSQPSRSVLYVSMGSFLSASTTQTDEIIAGVHDSGVRYLFVTRGDDSRFEIAEDRGCLVRWCDQLRVLRHPAVGGFWSHCGWNSTSEAMFAGVPVLTFPLYWDQLLIGKMMVDDWRIGKRVRRRSKEEGMVTREEIGKVVRDFMAGEGRREVAARAESVGEICRGAVGRGGSATCHLDAFVHEISRP